MADEHDTQLIIDLAKQQKAGGLELPQMGDVGPIPLISFPRTGGGVDVISAKNFYDEWRERPERISGVASARTVASFIELVNRHKSDHSAIFTNMPGESVLAVIDYHCTDHTPAFGKHRIGLGYSHSEQWGAWSSKDGVLLDQTAFAEFIEDRIADLVTALASIKDGYEEMFGTKFGTPAEILGVSRGLSLRAELKVKEIRNLSTGEAQIVYEEEHKDAGGAPLKVPGLFTLSIPVFEGGEPDFIVGRLRYKRTAQGLKWSIALHNVAALIRARLVSDFAEIAEQTGLPCYEGAPEV